VKHTDRDELAEESEEDDEAVTKSAVQRMHLNIQIKKKSLLVPLMMGLLLYATNVAAVPEWIIVAGIWRGWGALGSGFGFNVAFAIGAGLGTIGWYLVLVRWISKRRRGFAPSTLRKINLGTGIAMLVFGMYFVYQIIFATRWTEVLRHFHA
jgi:hypothetical protein